MGPSGLPPLHAHCSVDTDSRGNDGMMNWKEFVRKLFAEVQSQHLPSATEEKPQKDNCGKGLCPSPDAKPGPPSCDPVLAGRVFLSADSGVTANTPPPRTDMLQGGPLSGERNSPRDPLSICGTPFRGLGIDWYHDVTCMRHYRRALPRNLPDRRCRLLFPHHFECGVSHSFPSLPSISSCFRGH